MHTGGGVEEGKGIQKLASPEQGLVHFAQGRLVTDGLPFLRKIV
jgi:hypothetical protein